MTNEIFAELDYLSGHGGLALNKNAAACSS